MKSMLAASIKNTKTASPVSRPGSVDDLTPGSVDGLAWPGSADGLAPGPGDGPAPGSVDCVAPGSVSEPGSSADIQLLL